MLVILAGCILNIRIGVNKIMTDSSNLLSKVASYDAKAEQFHCDFSNHLMLGHLGNELLNVADRHSMERGYGMPALIKINRTWVLSRLAIEMNEMPVAYDKFTISTWIEDAKRFYTSRNFKVSGKNGMTLGYGRSIWAMIDVETRKPVDVFSVKDGLIGEYVDKDTLCPIKPASRVIINGPMHLARQIKPCYGDIDINGHVNSIKYLEHIIDLFPIELFSEYSLKRIDMAYVAESHYGDILNIYVDDSEYNVNGSTLNAVDCRTEENLSANKNADNISRIYNIRITKCSENEKNEVEVVRCSVKFVKV